MTIGNKYSFTFIIIPSFSFLQMNCQDEPPVEPPSPPSHPTITWVADTIKNPYEASQLQLYSIWGSDTNDVYAIGHNSAGGRASLYHFDGKKWSSIKVTWGEGGFINSNVSFLKIEGSSKNDVWAVGSRGSYFGSNIDSSLVIRFDGSMWKEVEMERSKHGIQGLKVISSNNIYFSGTYGEIYHYNGSTFTKSVIDSNLTIRLGGDNAGIVASGSAPFPNEYISVYIKETNGAWRLIKKTSYEEYYKYKNYGYRDFYPLGNGKYFAAGEGIYILDDTTWQTSYSQEDYPYVLLRGTSATNVFALSPFNRLLHWNGIDWKLLNIPKGLGDNPKFAGLWVTRNKIFISCLYSFDTNIIYRGTY